jgi:aconitate hydratase
MFKEGQDAESLGLSGQEKFSIDLKGGEIRGGEEVEVKTDNGKKFNVICRLDTEVEREYYRNGGILQFVMRKLAREEDEE